LDDDLLSPKAEESKGMSNTEMDFEEAIVPMVSAAEAQNTSTASEQPSVSKVVEAPLAF